jgi:phage terminase large subunit-like protein
MVTTTPRPTKLMRSIMADPGTVVTHGTTYDNRGNLAPPFLRRMLAKYEGTRLGRQELLAELLGDVLGALWYRDLIDDTRVDAAPAMQRIVVAIDPATTSNKKSDDTGIVVSGLGAEVDKQGLQHGYVLEDLTDHVTPNEWARLAIDAYHRHHADRIIGEVNNGGDLVETVIRNVDPNIPFTAVRASKGKYARAEPVAALYERNRIHHVGMFAGLEDQMCTWLPTDVKSPDSMDALVWGQSHLMLSPGVIVDVGAGLGRKNPWTGARG